MASNLHIADTDVESEEPNKVGLILFLKIIKQGKCREKRVRFFLKVIFYIILQKAFSLLNVIKRLYYIDFNFEDCIFSSEMFVFSNLMENVRVKYFII